LEVKKVTLVVLVAVAALAVAASASAGGWVKVRTASGSGDYYSSASMSTKVRNASQLGFTVSASSTAKVSGTIMCTNSSYDFESYDFAFRLRSGFHAVKVPLRHASCSIMASADLDNGGSVRLILWRA
jgi:hypothetical protein